MNVSDDYSITAKRNLKASVQQVWLAWTTPSLMAQWWGPDGFVSTVKTLDVRPDGRFEIVMHGPDGTDYANVYIFDRVVDRELLIYTNQGSAEFELGPFVSRFEIAPRTDAPQTAADASAVTLTAQFGTESDFIRHRDEFGAVRGAQQLLARLETIARTA